MSGTKISVRKDQQFQVRVRVPGDDGRMRDALPGEVTGVTLRLSATDGGTAIHADVNNLPAAERPLNAALQFVAIDKAILEARILPLGKETSFWAVWSKSGGFDGESKEFIIADGTVL